MPDGPLLFNYGPTKRVPSSLWLWGQQADEGPELVDLRWRVGEVVCEVPLMHQHRHNVRVARVDPVAPDLARLDLRGDREVEE